MRCQAMLERVQFELRVGHMYTNDWPGEMNRVVLVKLTDFNRSILTGVAEVSIASENSLDLTIIS